MKDLSSVFFLFVLRCCFSRIRCAWLHLLLLLLSVKFTTHNENMTWENVPYFVKPSRKRRGLMAMFSRLSFSVCKALYFLQKVALGYNTAMT